MHLHPHTLHVAEDLRRTQLRLAEYFEKKRSALHTAGEQALIEEGGATKRAAHELPYVLESVGEWARLRKCLSVAALWLWVRVRVRVRRPAVAADRHEPHMTVI